MIQPSDAHPAVPAATTGSGAPIPQIESLLLQAFLSNIPDHIYFKDLQSRFLAVSHAKAARDGLTPSQLIGKTDFDFFAESHARKAFDDEQAIIRTGQPMLDKLEKETWQDGRVTWVLTSKLSLQGSWGSADRDFQRPPPGAQPDPRKDRTRERLLSLRWAFMRQASLDLTWQDSRRQSNVPSWRYQSELWRVGISGRF